MSVTLVAPNADRRLKLSITKGFCLTHCCNFTFCKKKKKKGLSVSQDSLIRAYAEKFISD